MRLVVPRGAGNITDQVARVLADELVRCWGGRLVVDNQPGAGGVVGVLQLIRAPADGTTLDTVSVAAMAIVPHTTKPARYDPLTDLTPIAGISVSSSFMAVHASVPARTLAELAAHARSRPAENPLFYCSPGNGAAPHLNLETIRRALDFPMQHAPCRTSAAGNTDLIANRVQVTIDSASITLSRMKAGTLRPIALRDRPEAALSRP